MMQRIAMNFGILTMELVYAIIVIYGFIEWNLGINSDNMKAVVLAAGRGSRLGSLTDEKPKAMIKVDYVPILIRNINTLKKAGIPTKDVIMVVGYKGDMIKYYCMQMPATFVTQYTPDGTANAINLAKEHIDENFIVISADIVYV